MVATAIMILLIWGLIKRDQQNRDGNLRVMDSLVGEILQRPRYPRLISVRTDPPKWLPSGRWLLGVIIIILVIIDIILALIYGYHPNFLKY